VLDGDCCHACGADLWYEMSFDRQQLTRARQVSLSRTSLDRCHASTTRIAMVAAALTGGQPHRMATQDVIAVLRAHIARPDEIA
jgi:hypothetical protein